MTTKCSTGVYSTHPENIYTAINRARRVSNGNAGISTRISNIKWESRYGISSNDVDLDVIADSQDEDWSPTECVELIANKYKLPRIDTGHTEK
jgi:hypothetical protein